MQKRFCRMRGVEASVDRGFTLIEVLAVVVILGILVAIAVPLYSNYRTGAKNKSTETDVRNAVTAIEQWYSANGDAYPEDKNNTASHGTAVALGGTGGTVTVSPGTHLAMDSDGTTSYYICAMNDDGDTVYFYDSANAGSVGASLEDNVADCLTNRH